MTNIQNSLEDVALGDLGHAEVREIISRSLADLDDRSVQKVYTALRAWVWKALNERRRDQELRDWYHMLRSYSAGLAKSHPAHSERLRVLYELIYESISVSELLPVSEVLTRSHVSIVLQRLDRAPLGMLSKAQLMASLGVKQSNLSRIMGLVRNTGLVSKTQVGKAAFYVLTAEGRAAAMKQSPKRISSPGVVPAAEKLLSNEKQKQMATFEPHLSWGVDTKHNLHKNREHASRAPEFETLHEKTAPKMPPTVGATYFEPADTIKNKPAQRQRMDG